MEYINGLGLDHIIETNSCCLVEQTNEYAKEIQHLVVSVQISRCLGMFTVLRMNIIDRLSGDRVSRKISCLLQEISNRHHFCYIDVTYNKLRESLLFNNKQKS